MTLIKPKILVLAGPTASGKSNIASLIAQEYNGVIVNFDAYQVYKELPIISASPTLEEKKSIPHYLYNYLNIHDKFSVKIYIDNLTQTLQHINQDNKLVILVGGTHMYLHSLMYGLHEIPSIDQELITSSQKLLDDIGAEAFYNELIKLDTEIADYIKPLDYQRALRAYQVKMQTGKSIKTYQQEDSTQFLKDYDVKLFILNPDRDILYKNCNDRFLRIVREGGLDEVRALLPILNENNYSISNAIGVKELKDYLNGIQTFDQAIAIGQQRTRNFAKRQITWCKNKFHDKIILNNFNEFVAIKPLISQWLNA